MILRWHRALTAEDVETARLIYDLHMPGAPDMVGRRKCMSALHLVVPPRWPCAQAEWCDAVLAAEARGEIPPAST